MENILNFLQKPNSNKRLKIVPPSINACSSVNFAHKWTIANYGRLYRGHPWKWEICSDKFSPPNNGFLKLKLYLKPKNEKSPKDYVLVGFGIYNMPQVYEGKIKCQWNVSILDQNGDKCETKEMKCYYLYSNQWEICAFIKYSELLDCASKYLPKGHLTLQFEIHLQAAEPIFNMLTNNEIDTSQSNCADKVTKVVHTWTIENITDLLSGGAASPLFIPSDGFHAPGQQDERFCLKLYLNGTNADNVDIAISNSCKTSITVHGKLSILDVNGVECDPFEGTRKFESAFGMLYKFDRATLLDYSNGFVYNDKLTIYCEIYYMVSENLPVVDAQKKTIPFVELKWTIEKFRAFCLSTSEDISICSQIFNTSTDTNTDTDNKFRIRLTRPDDHEMQHEKYLSFDFCNLSNEKVTAQNRMSILNANGDKCTLWGEQETISEHGIVRNSKFLPLSCVQDPAFIEQYLPDDRLTIIFEIWIIQDMKLDNKTSTTSAAQSLSNYPSGSAISLQNCTITNAIMSFNSTVSLNDFNASSSTYNYK